MVVSWVGMKAGAMVANLVERMEPIWAEKKVVQRVFEMAGMTIGK